MRSTNSATILGTLSKTTVAMIVATLVWWAPITKQQSCVAQEADGAVSTGGEVTLDDLRRPAPWPNGEFGFNAMLSRGYTPLFNGRDLDGWRNPYAHGHAEVVDGEIHLTGDDKFFLVTDRRYSDFRLSAEIQLPQGPANSGIMFRCHVDPDAKKIVYGYQAECDGSDRRWSGGLYDESRRGWIYPSTEGRSEPQFLKHEAASKAAFAEPAIRDALRRDDWNRFVITAIGDSITIELNGVVTTTMRDAEDHTGFIAIQHHGENGQTYRFRNIFLKELPDVPAADTVELVRQDPVAIEKINDKVTMVDFGKVAFGNLELRLPEGGSGYANIHFGERLVDGRIDREPPGTVRYAMQKLRLGAGESGTVVVAPPPEQRNTEQVGVGSSHPPAVLTPASWTPVIPFRWVEIEGWPQEFSSEAIRRRAAFSSQWNDDASDFRCSDPTLNAIWDLCKYSIKATTFAGVYVDGDRERIPYEADAYLNQLSHYATDDDVEMAARTFDWLMAHGTWPTEWAPHMVMMAHAHWMQTGDVDWLAYRYESLKTKTLLDRVGDDGLVRSDEMDQKKHDIVDWPRGERDKFVFTPINTVVNAFHIEAMKRMAVMADAIGESDEAARWRQQIAKATEAFRSKLFDPKQNLFRDGVGTEHHSAHANFIPLAFGLVPDDAVGPVVDWLRDRGMPCSVYAAQYLLDGLFDAGADDHAIDLIVADTDRSWRHMVESGTTISWEAWDLKYKPNQDWNHAWGAAPANLLPRHVLGVQPAAPGWDRIRISPQTGSLSSAAGKVPTAKGSVQIDWKRGDADGDDVLWSMQCRLPDGVAADVDVPAMDPAAKVRVDGESVEVVADGDRWRIREPLIGGGTIEVVAGK